MNYINSGSIGINITHSQDTAVPCPYDNRGRDTAVPCPRYHSDATGNDIIDKMANYPNTQIPDLFKKSGI
ncbi:hypothetical protein QUB05_03995 [Microcoleus sp. F10-C6]|uniref:hypothetical protein n=1 Tax=unclassified Microcoleus TaxID=2642155 RepID=UPI002FD67F0E